MDHFPPGIEYLKFTDKRNKIKKAKVLHLRCPKCDGKLSEFILNRERGTRKTGCDVCEIYGAVSFTSDFAVNSFTFEYVRNVSSYLGTSEVIELSGGTIKKTTLKKRLSEGWYEGAKKDSRGVWSIPFLVAKEIVRTYKV